MTAAERRSTWAAATLVAHLVLAPLTALILAGTWHLGAAVWQLLLAAGAAALLHVGVSLAGRRPWAGYGIGALAMLVLMTMPFPGWSPGLLPSAACFPLTLWRLTAMVRTRSAVAALAVTAAGIVFTELVAWARLPAGVPGWTRLAEGGLLMLIAGGGWLAALLARRGHEARVRAERERLAAAVAGERAGIRRDLHDVIAHTVTVMVARIEAAAVTTTDPATRRELGDIGHGGTLATWTGDMVFSPAKGVAAIVLTNSVGDPALLTANLLAGRLGVPATPMSNPLTVVNAVLLGLTAGMSALLVTAAVRARRWVARRRASRRPWLVPRLLPLAVVTVLGVLLPALMGVQAGVFSFQYWIVTAWLLPLLVLFSLTCCVLGTVALARRLWCLRRAGHASTEPASA
ncbi:histidine kinase [Nonomuraea rubra]|uniref:histidine kinase n=1 Tax=Nonomuraea rubra TaxID=46180 RepID=UPI0016170ED2